MSTAFLDVPAVYIYDISTSQLRKELIYKTIGEDVKTLVIGGNHNASILEIIAHESDSIVLGFGQHETSILAGGLFSPDIEIASNEASQLNLDIENIYFSEEIFEYLLVNEIVKNMEIDNYINVENNNHTILRFELNENFSEYSCEFVDEGEGYRSLHIRFR